MVEVDIVLAEIGSSRGSCGYAGSFLRVYLA